MKKTKSREVPEDVKKQADEIVRRFNETQMEGRGCYEVFENLKRLFKI